MITGALLNLLQTTKADILSDIAYIGGAVVVISLSLMSLYWIYRVFQIAELQNLEMADDGFHSSRSDFIEDSEISDLKMENDDLNGAEVHESDSESQREDFIWESEVSELRMESDSFEIQENDSESQREDFIWEEELSDLRVESDSVSFEDEQPLESYYDSPEYSGFEEPEYA